ncbi:MAG: hypothetical protein QOC39_09030 [Nitrososphaeraceae archaeon]|nr:hypothetical protein [Nitrososphaeraceae archaeon]
MNEMKLKDLFVSSLESSHILNSKGGSVSSQVTKMKIILKKKKVYNEQNKEHIKEYKKNYWLDNKEQLKLKHREYHKRKNGNGIQMS